jgi:hypothetical protein
MRTSTRGVWLWLALSAFALASGCTDTSDLATPTATEGAPLEATATPVAALGELLRDPDLRIDADDLPQFVLRADDLTEVGENFRVWRDAPIDYDVYVDIDPVLLSPIDDPRPAEAGYVAHLVGRDGLTAIHAITAAELYADATEAAVGFAATVEAMTDGCLVLNADEASLSDHGDEAVMVTATRTCSFGEPSRFGAVVSRHGSLVTTSVIQRWDRGSVDETALAAAEGQAAVIAAALSGAGRGPETETSTFGLCIPDPDEPAPEYLDTNWRENKTDKIRTFTQARTTAGRDRDAIHQAALDTLSQANEVLGTSYGGPIDIYFYESIEQLQEGSPAVGDDVLGLAFGQEVHQLCGGTLDGRQWVNMAMSGHEYTHIITLNLWGRTKSALLIEGLAHYVTVGERDSMVANFRIEPLLPLATTTDDDDTRGRAWGTLIASYLIEERGGIDPFRDLWLAGRTATLSEAVEDIYGLTLEDLEEATRLEYDLKRLK